MRCFVKEYLGLLNSILSLLNCLMRILLELDDINVSLTSSQKCAWKRKLSCSYIIFLNTFITIYSVYTVFIYSFIFFQTLGLMVEAAQKTIYQEVTKKKCLKDLFPLSTRYVMPQDLRCCASAIFFTYLLFVTTFD